MKYLVVFIFLSYFQSFNFQCSNLTPVLSNFTTDSFVGTWYVYQRSYTIGILFILYQLFKLCKYLI